jgi:succinate-semialdehyde dehydrogenase / glutarate-semialdehyde dehydrogenase
MKQIIQKLKKNQTKWFEMGIDSRTQLLKKFHTLLKKNKTKIANSITKDINKPISQSKGEIDFNIGVFKWYLDNVKSKIKEKVIQEDVNQITKIKYFPKGVYSVILPWNFPFGIFISGVIPNLLVGNTVIVKFSEYNQNYARIMNKILSECLELNKFLHLIYGDKIIGEKIISQDIDGVWFTGSRKTGERISKKLISKSLIPHLELGGSNPGIIFPDVDIDDIINKIYFERFFNNGQYCDAIKRIIIHVSKKEEFIDKMLKSIYKRKIGNPFNKITELGPLANKKFFKILKGQYTQAIKKGAIPHKIKTKYKHELFFEPVLFSNIDTTMKIWKEEIFGPILPIITYQNIDEAILLANSTEFDLGANIFTNDQKTKDYVVSKLKAGNIEINNTNHWNPEIPFGGLRYSGNSKEYGEFGFHQFCFKKIICNSKIN